MYNVTISLVVYFCKQSIYYTEQYLDTVECFLGQNLEKLIQYQIPASQH